MPRRRTASRPTIRLAAAAFFALPVVVGASPPGWVRFAPPEGVFEVSMPQAPERELRSRLSPFGRVTTRIDIARLADRLFVVNHTRLPRMAVWLGVDSYVFETTRQNLLEENRGEERSYEDTSRRGLEGKLLLFDSPPWRDRPAWRWRAEIYVVSGRLVVFLANVPLESPAEELHPFFESVSFSD